MRPSMTRAAVVSLCLVLAACQDTPPPPPEEGGAAGAKGEVLEGTISDQMLPLDTIMQPAPSATPDGQTTSETAAPAAAQSEGAAGASGEPGAAEDEETAAPDAE